MYWSDGTTVKNEKERTLRVKKLLELMANEDGGLARHNQECENDIDFENTKVKGKEMGKNRKEQSLRAIH